MSVRAGLIWFRIVRARRAKRRAYKDWKAVSDTLQTMLREYKDVDAAFTEAEHRAWVRYNKAFYRQKMLEAAYVSAKR